MPTTDKYNLFGPTPEEVKSAARTQAMQGDIALAKLSPMEAVRKANISSARVFGDTLNKLAGIEDPNVSQAGKMQLLKSAVETDASEKGIDLTRDPEGYFQLLTDRALAMGMTEVPLSALPMINKLRQLRIDERNAQARLEAARTTRLAKPKATKTRSKQNRLAAFQYINNSWENYNKLYKVSESDFKDVEGYDTLLNAVQDAVSFEEANANTAGRTFDRGEATQRLSNQMMARISRPTPEASAWNRLWFKPKYYSTAADVRAAVKNKTLAPREAERILIEGF